MCLNLERRINERICYSSQEAAQSQQEPKSKRTLRPNAAEQMIIEYKLREPASSVGIPSLPKANLPENSDKEPFARFRPANRRSEQNGLARRKQIEAHLLGAHHTQHSWSW